jgi:hypothetical protein
MNVYFFNVSSQPQYFGAPNPLDIGMLFEQFQASMQKELEKPEETEGPAFEAFKKRSALYVRSEYAKLKKPWVDDNGAALDLFIEYLVKHFDCHRIYSIEEVVISSEGPT